MLKPEYRVLINGVSELLSRNCQGWEFTYLPNLMLAGTNINNSNNRARGSIGANQTGGFSDNSDTDTINSGDLMDVGITPGSTALE
jgi:hypothetical protein